MTGSIWGRIIWGIWWTWDARLTSALVCWLLYAGYLMLRHAIEEPTQRATFAAVFTIFAFIDVPIVIFSIKWLRTQHPQPVFWGGGSLPPDWTAIFGWNVLAMMLIGVVFTAVRLRQEESSAKSIPCAAWRTHSNGDSMTHCFATCCFSSRGGYHPGDRTPPAQLRIPELRPDCRLADSGGLRPDDGGPGKES